MIQFWQSRHRFSNEKKANKKERKNKEYNENGRKKINNSVYFYINQKSIQKEFTKSNTGGNLFNKIFNVVKNVGKGSREKNPTETVFCCQNSSDLL